MKLTDRQQRILDLVPGSIMLAIVIACGVIVSGFYRAAAEEARFHATAPGTTSVEPAPRQAAQSLVPSQSDMRYYCNYLYVKLSDKPVSQYVMQEFREVDLCKAMGTWPAR